MYQTEYNQENNHKDDVDDLEDNQNIHPDFNNDDNKVFVNESTKIKLLEVINLFCKDKNLKFIEEEADYWSIKYKVVNDKCIFYCIYSDFNNNKVYLIYNQKIGSSALRCIYYAIRDKNSSPVEDEHDDNFNVIIKFLVKIFQWAFKKFIAFLFNGIKKLLSHFNIKLNLDSIIKYLDDKDEFTNTIPTQSKNEDNNTC